MSDQPIETHPLRPFLPATGRILFLGSFPPPRTRWSMDFFYPNIMNDFWRIMGLIFHDDKDAFVVSGERRFDYDAIVAFAHREGLAFYDTASAVRRLKGNASDNFLEIVTPTDVAALLAEMPMCERIVTTGGKASEELQRQLGVDVQPSIGTCVTCRFADRDVEWWRMPSSSRAYPLALPKKAELYRRLFV